MTDQTTQQENTAPEFGFELKATDGTARRGEVTTAHGTFQTPAFMTVGTAGTVKGLTPDQLRNTGAEVVLGNTYHLMLRPTAELVAEHGGLHKFMDWPHPILTDSGGYQVMSLSGLRKITEEGVTFQSHIDGSRHNLTPERSIEIQDLLDSNITMVLDECTPYPATHKEAAVSMQRSMRWAERCRKAFRNRPGYGLFGIVQGSTYEDLRHESIRALTDIGFEGYAVGGLAVGEGQKVMFDVLDFTMPAMPTDKPRYLMGVGKPSDLVGAVARGIDMFDCVLPTRSGRNGQAFTRHGALNMRNNRHRNDPRPLDENCGCMACTRFSRAYIKHLFTAKEMLGPILLTIHNLTYYQDLMAGMREAIENGRFEEFQLEFHRLQEAGDIPPLD
ncbi:tRNA guanosine(34) transglycosylase Tgt [Kiloniella sp. b19]|uniref:tRNA guanosine(34) transglycosylase Tgt n=1 Tax=Kiloniella sp. GXU_MW_B19 TaxID=3141326 RepID=UPI0031DC9057